MSEGALSIPADQWAEAAGAYVQGPSTDELWRIVGFIDQPAVILRRVGSSEERVLVMGAPDSAQYTRLQPVPSV